MYYLGIDGGGTKTLFTLCDNEGKIISAHRAGSCYFLALGEQAIANLLKDGFEKCTVGIDKKDVYTYCGMPSVGEHDGVDSGLEHIRKTIGFGIEFGNDVVCAAAGSLMFRPGIHLIAGTGSNAMGFDIDGNSTRAGGWGCEVGGDEASAYYLATEMFHEFTKQSDYRHPRTLLYDTLRKKFKLDSDFEICEYIASELKMDREAIASQAIIATELYNMGDEAIKTIFAKAADELCEMALSIKNRLNFGKTADVSYSGGVFKSGEAILAPLGKKLSDAGMTLCKPCAEPVIGSVLLAARAMGEAKLEIMKENLKNI